MVRSIPHVLFVVRGGLFSQCGSLKTKKNLLYMLLQLATCISLYSLKRITLQKKGNFLTVCFFRKLALQDLLKFHELSAMFTAPEIQDTWADLFILTPTEIPHSFKIVI